MFFLHSDEVASYDMALAIEPNYSITWYNHGVVLVKPEKYTEALASFDTAIAIKLDYANALNAR